MLQRMLSCANSTAKERHSDSDAAREAPYSPFPTMPKWALIVVNRWLGLGVWDYSGVRGNLLGQVCMPFFTAWMPLSAFAAVADDFLRLLVFHEPFPPISLF